MIQQKLQRTEENDVARSLEKEKMAEQKNMELSSAEKKIGMDGVYFILFRFNFYLKFFKVGTKIYSF